MNPHGNVTYELILARRSITKPYLSAWLNCLGSHIGLGDMGDM